MAVFLGTPPADGFGRVPNDWMRDPKIKGLAKAVLAYLVGHRDGYKLTIKQMVAEFREGEDALYAAIKELIAAGYLKRVQRRGRGGVVGEVDFYVIGADGKFQQVATASGFSGTGKPGSGTTSNNAEFSQVATASGFTASGSTGSGESGTEKNNPKKTKDLKDEEKTTSSCAADPAGPRSAPPKEEGEISNDQQTDNHTTAANIANHYRPHITAIEARRLTHPITDALTNGWTIDAIRTELDADHTGLANLAAGLISRARAMAGSPPPPPPPAKTSYNGDGWTPQSPADHAVAQAAALAAKYDRLDGPGGAWYNTATGRLETRDPFQPANHRTTTSSGYRPYRDPEDLTAYDQPL